LILAILTPNAEAGDAKEVRKEDAADPQGFGNEPEADRGSVELQRHPIASIADLAI
jgi:hypothetical protein